MKRKILYTLIVMAIIGAAISLSCSTLPQVPPRTEDDILKAMELKDYGNPPLNPQEKIEWFFKSFVNFDYNKPRYIFGPIEKYWMRKSQADLVLGYVMPVTVQWAESPGGMAVTLFPDKSGQLVDLKHLFIVFSGGNITAYETPQSILYNPNSYYISRWGWMDGWKKFMIECGD